MTNVTRERRRRRYTGPVMRQPALALAGNPQGIVALWAHLLAGRTAQSTIPECVGTFRTASFERPRGVSEVSAAAPGL